MQIQSKSLEGGKSSKLNGFETTSFWVLNLALAKSTVKSKVFCTSWTITEALCMATGQLKLVGIRDTVDALERAEADLNHTVQLSTLRAEPKTIIVVIIENYKWNHALFLAMSCKLSLIMNVCPFKNVSDYGLAKLLQS